MPDSILTGPALTQRFDQLNALLTAHEDLWRPKPFTQLTLKWETRYPQLSQWLRARSLEDAEAAHQQPWTLNAPEPFASIAREVQVLIEVGNFEQTPYRPQPSARQINAVPGRKLAQIQAFADSLKFVHNPGHWLDWCAGKGHLGRWLTLDDQAVTCLEYDAELVAAGVQLSQRLGVNAQHLLQDVLDDSVHGQLQARHTPVALHACGDLHVRLLQLASTQGCRQLAVAPCCYNRISTEHYQPLSTAAQASTLRLSREDLGLPLNEAVTASPRIRRQRDQSMAWRLAFDLLQRQVRGIDTYLPTPSLSRDWFDLPFADFCQRLGEQRGLAFPQHHDWTALEAQGWQRLAHVRNLELVRQLFRRPLELWLILDRALYLQQQGYSVMLGSFCDYQLSPRNLLLLAER